MKKMLALALAASFALVGFAAEEKKAEAKKPACGMACCEKNKAASCKDCPDCGKKAGAKKAAKPACGMACCEKNKAASCKECPDCGGKKAAK